MLFDLTDCFEPLSQGITCHSAGVEPIHTNWNKFKNTREYNIRYLD